MVHGYFGVLTWDGTHIWVEFVLDCHDRQIINHFSSTIGITGENIREMLLGAVEERFGQAECPHTIQLLSDNDRSSQAGKRSILHLPPDFRFVRHRPTALKVMAWRGVRENLLARLYAHR
ncbi:MAG: hypothetical protein NZM26_02365 [Patescibacteria group bacterium]|nr:hypothetical protein [Patescibacteria group bacterium]